MMQPKSLMRHRFHRQSAYVAVLLALVAGPAEVGAQPILENEVDADGLHRVDPTFIDNAWLRPDIDLSEYTHAFVMPTLVLFRDVPPPSNAIGGLGRDAFGVDDRMQRRLRETFGEAFHQAMSASPDFEIADELGRNVVLVRGYVTDVVTALPPEFAGSNVGPVKWLWEGNLVVELRDSMSDEILVRILNHQRVEGPAEAEMFWSLAPRVTGLWSRFMVEQMSKVSDFYPSHLRRMYERAREESE